MGDELFDLEAGVPDIGVAHRCKRRHPFAVLPDRVENDPLLMLHREAAVTGGYQHAHREPLDVPLPRARKCLVEVVDVEDESPLGRCVQPKVREMCIPAALRQ